MVGRWTSLLKWSLFGGLVLILHGIFSMFFIFTQTVCSKKMVIIPNPEVRPQKGHVTFQPSSFRGELAVSFREGNSVYTYFKIYLTPRPTCSLQEQLYIAESTCDSATSFAVSPYRVSWRSWEKNVSSRRSYATLKTGPHDSWGVSGYPFHMTFWVFGYQGDFFEGWKSHLNRVCSQAKIAQDMPPMMYENQ